MRLLGTGWATRSRPIKINEKVEEVDLVEKGPTMEEHKSEHIKKRAFLVALAVGGTISGAAKAANISRTNHYKWLKDDPVGEYAAAFAQAKEEYADSLEQEVTRRARDGVKEPVYYQGKIVGYVLRYSDNLLMFKLKGERPEKFQERLRAEMMGKDGSPIMIKFADPEEE